MIPERWREEYALLMELFKRVDDEGALKEMRIQQALFEEIGSAEVRIAELKAEIDEIHKIGAVTAMAFHEVCVDYFGEPEDKFWERKKAYIEAAEDEMGLIRGAVETFFGAPEPINLHSRISEAEKHVRDK